MGGFPFNRRVKLLAGDLRAAHKSGPVVFLHSAGQLGPKLTFQQFGGQVGIVPCLAVCLEQPLFVFSWVLSKLSRAHFGVEGASVPMTVPVFPWCVWFAGDLCRILLGLVHLTTLRVFPTLSV